MTCKRIPAVCEHCGQSFMARAFQVKKGYGRYCSRPCYFRHRYTDYIDPRSIARECQNCGKMFRAPSCQVIKGQAKFCSRECCFHSYRTGDWAAHGPKWTAEEASALGGKLIPITGGLSTLVDEADYDYLNSFRWCLADSRWNYYVAGYVNGSKQSLHRFILNAPPGTQVDHVNHNGLDNRRCNIRLASASQNAANRRPQSGSSRFKGVTRSGSKLPLWRVYITANRKRLYLGTFADEIEAAKAYDAKAKELYGEFALLNFPE